jgi:hypothetical protein
MLKGKIEQEKSTVLSQSSDGQQYVLHRNKKKKSKTIHKYFANGSSVCIRDNFLNKLTLIQKNLQKEFSEVDEKKIKVDPNKPDEVRFINPNFCQKIPLRKPSMFVSK